MRLHLLIACTLPLSACASTQTVLSKEPTEVLFSSKSPGEVAFCLANKNNTSVLDRDDGSKVVLIKSAVGVVGVAFSVYPDPKGSRVEYRRETISIGVTWRQCVA